MASVFDVAAYILQRTGKITTMKLQKLVYYCQAWSLVWDEKRLFPEQIRAWANGPVVQKLYDAHRGMFKISSIANGDSSKLNSEQKDTIKAVLAFYGDKPSQWLSDLTHLERPWRDARQGLADSERGTAEITLAAMSEYYGGLQPKS